MTEKEYAELENITLEMVNKMLDTGTFDNNGLEKWIDGKKKEWQEEAYKEAMLFRYEQGEKQKDFHGKGIVEQLKSIKH